MIASLPLDFDTRRNEVMPSDLHFRQLYLGLSTFHVKITVCQGLNPLTIIF